MKDIIEQLYKITIIRINEYKTYFILSDYESVYILKEINDPKSLLKRLHLLTNEYHQVIYNVNNDLVININEKKYILLKPIHIKEIINAPKIIFTMEESEWNIELWEKKIDAYRDYLNLNIDIDKKVYYNLVYFIGLTENIITYYNSFKGKNIRKTICHNLITSPTYGINYFDPTNTVIDNIGRELCDFFKARNSNVEEILRIIKEYNLSNDEINMFICRLLYPKYFFNWIDDYLIKRETNGFIEVINKEKENIKLYKELIIILKKSNYFVEEISWIL